MKLQSFDEFLSEGAKYSGDKNHAMSALHGLYLRNQIHIFHWQTEVGPKHEALGEFYDSFLSKLDELTEVCMGKHGRISVKGTGTPPPYLDLKDIQGDVDAFVEKYVALYGEFRNSVYANDPEIQNIIDEIVASMHKLKYLLTMS